jgi:diaminopimelate epimerase
MMTTAGKATEKSAQAIANRTAHFQKYHGLGNDYVVIDPNVCDVEMTEANIRLLCDRNFGIGSDGILHGPVFEGDLPSLRIFNPDGSEAEKSGNGLRIFAKYLFEKKYVGSKNFQIKTLGGIVDVQIKDETANLIRINMGNPTFFSNEIPVAGERREVVNELLEICGVRHRVTCLSIGNPHCVILMPQVSEQIARELGPHVESHERFIISWTLLPYIDGLQSGVAEGVRLTSCPCCIRVP